MRNVPDTLTNERTAVFIDYHNTQNALRRAGRQIDLVGLQDYLAEGRHLIETFLYIATHPQPEQQEVDQANQQRLRQLGFMIRSKQGQMLPNGRLKCNFDLDMALDVQEFVARPGPTSSCWSPAMATSRPWPSGCGCRAPASRWPRRQAASRPPCRPWPTASSTSPARERRWTTCPSRTASTLLASRRSQMVSTRTSSSKRPSPWRPWRRSEAGSRAGGQRAVGLPLVADRPFVTAIRNDSSSATTRSLVHAKGANTMATAIINGRRVQIPPVASVEDIRKAGGIAEGRNIIRRNREGNFVVRPGEEVAVNEGDAFVDAPPRVKGLVSHSLARLPRSSATSEAWPLPPGGTRHGSRHGSRTSSTSPKQAAATSASTPKCIMIAERFSQPPYQGVVYDEENGDWLVIPNYPLPERFQAPPLRPADRLPGDLPRDAAHRLLPEPALPAAQRPVRPPRHGQSVSRRAGPDRSGLALVLRADEHAGPGRLEAAGGPSQARQPVDLPEHGARGAHE